jgi:hypothetical protein
MRRITLLAARTESSGHQPPVYKTAGQQYQYKGYKYPRYNISPLKKIIHLFTLFLSEKQ